MLKGLKNTNYSRHIALERSVKKGKRKVQEVPQSQKSKRKVQGVPQSQTAALPRPQEEEETDNSKQALTEQTYGNH